MAGNLNKEKASTTRDKDWNTRYGYTELKQKELSESGIRGREVLNKRKYKSMTSTGSMGSMVSMGVEESLKTKLG